MIKKTLKKDGDYELIELWSNGKTDYRVQENKYGEEWDWSDYTSLEEAESEFDKIVAFVKESKEAEEKAEADDAELEKQFNEDVQAIRDEEAEEKAETPISDKVGVVDFYDIEWRSKGFYVYEASEKQVNLESKKMTVKSVLDNKQISWSLKENDNQLTDENVDSFFVQVKSDDNSHFTIFMEWHKEVYPEIDLGFFDSVDEIMECSYIFEAQSKESKALQSFLKTIGAIKEEYID